MANRLKANPWVLDTASATPVTTAPMTISHFQFVAYGVATDNVVLKDKDGNEVWKAVGHTDLSPVDSGYRVATINGLALTTLVGAGHVLVYFE